MHTILGAERSRPWKCILFSDLKTQRPASDHRTCMYWSQYMHASCPTRLMYGAIEDGQFGGQAPQESRGVWGAARHPNLQLGEKLQPGKIDEEPRRLNKALSRSVSASGNCYNLVAKYISSGNWSLVSVFSA